jgi:gamma-glutamyltranspeptidase/glutathione hydrolase
MPRLVLPLLVLLVAPAGACRDAPPPARPDTTRTEARPDPAARGLVVAGHAEASRVGVAVLRAGGNGVDAAVAVGFALAVVLPNAGNVGGGGFLLVRFPDGTATSMDFRETAPAAATAGMFLGADGEPVRGRSVRGHLAAGVPGSVAGLLEAHRRWGRLPLDRLIDPAIRLAEEGYPLTRRDAHLLNYYREDFLAFPSTARYFATADGRPYAAGARFVQRDLAAVLRRIRERGRDGFYRGETADLIVAEMRRGGGLLTHADLAAYEPVERPVLTGRYRGHRVLTMGPPATGGIALLQLLRAVEPYDLRARGLQTPATAHLMGEAMRRAFADRARWLGDPAFVDVPAAALTDSAYVRARMASFRPDAATPSADVAAGTPAPRPEGSETTHYSIVDEEGTAVAVTTTINDYFGSKVVVHGAGFFLNDEMDDFAAAPGRPNLWGLVQGEANAVRPGARPASSMTPTIVEDPRGRLRLVVGSPGGARIISTVFQVVTHVLDYGLDVQTAVALPRVHHQWLPDVLEVEPAFPDEARPALEALGWTVEEVSTFGAADAILVEYGRDGRRRLYGGADPRRENDTALGF